MWNIENRLTIYITLDCADKEECDNADDMRIRSVIKTINHFEKDASECYFILIFLVECICSLS